MMKIPPAPSAKELLDKAFSRARKSAASVSARDSRTLVLVRELRRMETASGVVTSKLDVIVKDTPSLKQLPVFYYELASLLVDTGRLRKSLAAVQWASDQARKLLEAHKQKVKKAPVGQMASVRLAFFGRLSSVVKQVRKDLEFIDQCRRALRRLPSLKDMPTIVIAGCPNVGKSSILKALTGAEPDIQHYPFTTTELRVGILEKTLQLVDTPGLLDRPLARRNDMERRSIIALKHLASRIVYVFDLSESCGYPVTDQLNLYREIRRDLKTPVIACFNKSDLPEAEGSEKARKAVKAKPFDVSARSGEGVSRLKEELLKGIMPGKEKFYRKEKS